ncbi:MAG TPA: polyphosphate polymerase domain-containing protein [Firmicutes bacterium]|nr:polyphosphate polymerase domain-containing protein [Bacillota bacterium]
MNEVFRQEKKYLMTLPDLYKISAQLDRVMLQDSHNGAQGYRIRSLYFDTLDERDFTEKIDGIEVRKKIRLRNYGADTDFAMLEMKQKQGIYQKKRSLRLEREDARQLIQCNYTVLQKYDEPFAAECYGVLHCQCYRPKAVVEYQRKAYIARENQIRVTFDHHIIATETSFDIFSPSLNLYPVLDPFQAVLEVKYNGFLLSYLKNLINMADRSELSVSKYCLARSAGMQFGF